MVNYRRNLLPGGAYFFTVALRDRQGDLLIRHVALLRDAFRTVRRRQPFTIDAIVIMPCGWDIARARLEAAPLTKRPEWSRLRAVSQGRVVLTDGNQYFNRPGPRIVESAEILAEVLYPDTFDFGHRHTAWVPFPAA